MGFFDGLEQKMKSASEVSNLSGKIRENEKLIEQYYYDLGKLYFEKYGENPHGEAQAVCKEIFARLDEIESLKKDLVVAKGMKICPNCNAECPMEVPFCSSCGSKLPMPEPPAQQEETVGFCSACGQKIAAGSAFCPACGTPVAKVAPAVVETVVAVEAPAAVEEFPQTATTEVPMVENFASTVELSTPVVEEPVVEVPTPVVEELAPVVEELAPVVEVPTPVVEVPTPMVEVTAPAIEPTAPEQNAVPDGMKVCPACGTLVVERALFCGSCGSKF